MAFPRESLRLLWAKFGDDGVHPLLWHCLDAGMVCEALLRAPAFAKLNRELARQWALSEEGAISWASFVVSLHDLGKGCASFQWKHEHSRCALRDAGLTAPAVFSIPLPHASVTAVTLEVLLQSESEPWPQLSRETARHFARVLGGHHGTFPLATDLNQVRRALIAAERNSQWSDMRKRLCRTLSQYVLGDSRAMPEIGDSPSAAATLLAGLTTLSDWLASNTEFFPYTNDAMEVPEYANLSRVRALGALARTGWNRGIASAQDVRFSALFNIENPRPLQIHTAEVMENNSLPRLIIIEAPMGEGKTEAALLAQQVMLGRLEQSGCYFALPTMAASNQMFSRLHRFLGRICNETGTDLHLLHGRALLSDEYAEIRARCVAVDSATADDAAVVAHEWFTQRKRGLLAPFAVGTVDQALMAVLQTRHGYLRLFGLANKTVIFDEVHAYDVYMLTVFERLMEWLRSLGCTVVILSATLPRQRTQALLKAFGASRTAELARYPRITSLDAAGMIASIETESTSRKAVQISWRRDDLNALIRELTHVLTDGGCVAWICNTVRRAQEVYAFLSNHVDHAEIELSLFHARYPFFERQEREQRCLDQFGPPVEGSQRPHRAILVATQVIEQSLDLDFDLMVTEFAPADLILQRSGRLHRHNRLRPGQLKQPALWLIQPSTSGDTLSFARVYDRYVMLRSWLALKDRTKIEIPDCVEPVIELVYGDEPLDEEPAYEALLRQAQRDFQEAQDKLRFDARSITVCSPEGGDILDEYCRELEEDNPDVHRTLQALTRPQTYPTVEIVCLHKIGNSFALDSEGAHLLDLEQHPSLERTKNILGNTVSVPDWAGLRDSPGLLRPRSWRTSALLRHYRVVPFEDRVFETEEWQIRWDADLGIVIRKNSKEDDTDESEL